MHELPPMCDRILYSKDEIAQRVRELGEEIVADHEGQELRLVTVLRGGLFFMADLARAIELPITMDFMAVAPYGPGAGGVVRVTKDLDDDIRGGAVILVEDVVDTGLTLNYVKNLLEAHGPRSVDVCALLDKQARRIAEVPLAYTGFAAPDRFLVGYGLDVRGRYRELPFVATVKDDAVGL